MRIARIGATCLFGVAALIALTIAACGNDDDAAVPPPTAVPDTTIEVEVAGGKPVDGVQRFPIDARDIVTIIVRGDTTDELHIHGYDLVVGFAPGQPGTITFEADIPGIFEAETHHRGDLVMELEVRCPLCWAQYWLMGWGRGATCPCRSICSASGPPSP